MASARGGTAASLFEPSSIMQAGSRTVPAYKIVCGQCGEQDKVTNNRVANGLPDEAIAGIFRNRGWSIGKRRDRHICPKCAARGRGAPTKENNVVELKPQADPPREMTRDDRRVIFVQLNEVYLDEKEGYSSGWTDARVAKHLGVPPAWVKQLREENFGSDGGNEETRLMIAAGQSVLDEIASARAGFEAEHAAAMKRLKVLEDEFSKRISDVKKSLGFK